MACATVPPCNGVGVTLGLGGREATAAYTHPRVIEVDNIQYDLDDGPCLDAIRTGRINVIDVMDDDRRWPEFAARAVDKNIHSSLSLPLQVRDETIGALNMYSENGPFGDEAQQLALGFSSYAAIALANARAHQEALDIGDNLRVGLESRDVIGQAKGILMERHRVTADRAFEMLKRASQHTNRKVRDVANDLAMDGELPE